MSQSPNHEPTNPSVLVVVAHPDDEVLGCGATLARLSNTGVPTQACILAGNAEVRTHRPDLPELREDTLRAQQILGLPAPILGPFPNIRLNTVAHVELVQFIEEAIVQTRATLVFTHHPGDLNDDHLQTSRACQAAVRLFQRRTDLPRLRGLYFMEIPSATDWALTPSPAFRPTAFCEIGPEMLDLKIRALRSYRGVMRPYPHPRSDEVLRGLAYCRGAQAGLNMAEAFEGAFSVLEWWG